MSGSPVYIDGKLVGAVALRMSVFSPDAICGITPIESMLEIQDFDTSRPAEPARRTKLPKVRRRSRTTLLQRLVAAGVSEAALPHDTPLMTPIETPLVFSGLSQSTLRTFEPLFEQMGITAVQGGGGGSSATSWKPVAGWENSLNPGDSVAASWFRAICRPPERARSPITTASTSSRSGIPS